MGTEFKTVADAASGIMVAMDICEGKEAMRAKEDADILGVTGSTTLRLIKGVSSSFDLTQDEDNEENNSTIFFGDSWFGSIKTAASIFKLKQHCCMAVKTSHSHSPKKWLEDKMETYPGGTWITLQGSFNGALLYCMGYKYNKRKVLTFVFTEGAGSIRGGDPYEARFPDKFGNLHIRKVPRPKILSEYFSKSNVIDKHNQIRQHELALEECWITSDPYFRLCSSLLGIVVTDSWKAMRYHYKKRADEPIRSFVNRLSFALLNEDSKIFEAPVENIVASLETVSSGLSDEPQLGGHTQLKLSKTKTASKLPTRSGSVSTTSYTKQVRCVWCSRVENIVSKTTIICKECGVGFCSNKTGRKCWALHVLNDGPPMQSRKRACHEI